MRKKVKSFTLDEDIYNSLATIFKENKVEGSLSLFVHNCLKEFLDYINGIQDELLRRRLEGFKVPLSYIIGEIVKNPLLMEQSKDHEIEDPKSDYGNIFISKYEQDAEIWNDKYEAEKIKVSLEFYAFLKTNLYELSGNKKYLIHKETGKRYIPVDSQQLVEIDID